MIPPTEQGVHKLIAQLQAAFCAYSGGEIALIHSAVINLTSDLKALETTQGAGI